MMSPHQDDMVFITFVVAMAVVLIAQVIVAWVM
jgi:hypothetical protein